MVYKEYIEWVQMLTGKLYGKEEGRAIAVRLLQHFCGISAYEHMVEPYGAIAPEILGELQSAAQQAAAARPLQYIIGYQEFMGLKIAVEEGVLIPRPETEELVNLVLNHIATRPSQSAHPDGLRILDAACGSGCIATALKHHLPESQIFACDLSPKALRITTRNLTSAQNLSSPPPDKSSSAHELSSEHSDFNYEHSVFKYEHSVFSYDLLKSPEEFPLKELDIIVSNPPYVMERERSEMRANVLDYEPAEALFVPDNDPLLFYRALEKLASATLKPGGAIFMEINENLSLETASIFKNAGYTTVEVKTDLFGKQRFCTARI
ncbi:peptide chain release factor N(5)-glutamine methyltransferase [Bacteroidota bacterium]